MDSKEKKDSLVNTDDYNFLKMMQVTDKNYNKFRKINKQQLSKNSNNPRQSEITEQIQLLYDIVDAEFNNFKSILSSPCFKHKIVKLEKDNAVLNSSLFKSIYIPAKIANYIKENAIVWAVEYEDEQTIDDINILQATQSAMHKGVKNVLGQLDKMTDVKLDNILLLVDGNYFKPYSTLNKTKTKLETIKYQMVEGGDNKYTSIAAASILAKVERDKYIEELCLQNPELIEHYGIDSNKGYGSKKHMDGIKQHGITKWHRKTFGICKEFA